ncbi:bifunctional helix-turn-helix domain-containing protein/methylated-DNA--[protein]-cysteine S-methyltransferase [Alisedimentitalea sp. MJ-SS2]|uniref:bifunctional helix-turn-helix domain-containing protein/methylated-DNA--[protein]-cysteine S-methyltransferase n=1 Tax=Aliisedimentitalea sp. MJ-SS2 TaxID=3049795 RepID=UPI0029087380|nr:bifunctional helix-turn-helix domain-containing protein/methylated-DNA--[protein]-cysteine S-methyltransferase [Alisedimentitalea sp. MJ-SS2]MDU8928091.1 bifunctional helix-turn-helix domain-containing protein/methylated-DNA--[protein]-cysteine S-methyltransferase [Alisedimentitalea sp. MJ-SS2]
MTADQNQSYHYHVMRRALDLIDAADAPLSLEDLASQMDMSPAHFQRLFSQWVGVSPKRYQQYLQLGQAKKMLSEHMTTLQVSHSLGLSGSGRLHDLFIRWEAMSPGEFARKGDGLEVFWGWFDSPFDLALVMGTEKGICGLAFAAETGTEAAMEDMVSRWPNATFTEDPMRLKPLVDAAFEQKGETALHMIGAPFQIKVWEALLQIPSGNVSTYSEIAQAVGKPRAVRAVGTAVGRNPVSWLIPCHRALRKSGALGGYHWGLPVKRALLAWESARAEA